MKLIVSEVQSLPIPGTSCAFEQNYHGGVKAFHSTSFYSENGWEDVCHSLLVKLMTT